MNRAVVSFLLCLLSGGLPLDAQEAKRLAVLPFNFIDLPQQEAQPVFAAFENALRRTEAYSVVGGDELAAAQENAGWGPFDCTSDRCAADLARRLSAEQWLRGELSRGEAGYTLRVRIVEAASARAIRLETLSSESLPQMIAAMELFAFKLSGLTVTAGKEERIAREFGELLVETIPAHAEIFVNGARRGRGPDLIRRVPLGRVRIAAQLGTLYAEKAVEVTRSLQQVRLELSELPSGLQLAAAGELAAYLDGTYLAPTAAARFDGLAPGVHTLELLGQGLYWREELVLRAGELTAIVPQLRPYGSIEYEIPPGASAEIRGRLLREVVSGSGKLQAPAGDYSVLASGREYEPLGLSLSVAKGAAAYLRPDLRFSSSSEQARFSRRIEEGEQAALYGYRLNSDDLRRLKELKQEISGSRHAFPELEARVDSLLKRAEAVVAESGTPADPERPDRERRLRELLGQKQQLELRIESRRLEGKRKNTGAWISFGAGLATGGLAMLFHFFSNEAYQDYQEGPGSWEEAQRLENAVKLWDISTIAALSASGICLVISSTLWLSRPSTREMRRELEALDAQIALMASSQQPH